MLFGSKKVLGIDIGSSSVKIVELEGSRGAPKLVSFAIAPTPPSSVSGGEILDVNSLSGVINSLLTSINTKRKKSAVGIWGNAVIVKKINLPSMDINLLNEQIRWEAEQYIPYDIQEINLEYHILKNQSQNTETMDVLLVAARKDLIISYIEAVELTGVQCSVLDVSSFALANCFTVNNGELPGEVIGVLDIGSGNTNLVVIDSGEVLFARDIPVGGGSYTSEIQRMLNITVEEAEGLKIDASMNRAVPQEVTEIISNVHELVCDEIAKSLDFFTTTSSDITVQRLFITGGGSQTSGIKQAIETACGKSVEIFNPLMGIQYNKSNFSHEYISKIAPLIAAGIGLGLREIGDR